jgi:TRAP-type C4-dicarboxylate transport system permease large subunit
MIPEMEKKGYPREYAAAVTASGSVQAILIPPSHNSVIYSLAAGGTVSIATLFIAGVAGFAVGREPDDSVSGFCPQTRLPERGADSV